MRIISWRGALRSVWHALSTHSLSLPLVVPLVFLWPAQNNHLSRKTQGTIQKKANCTQTLGESLNQISKARRIRSRERWADRRRTRCPGRTSGHMEVGPLISRCVPARSGARQAGAHVSFTCDLARLLLTLQRFRWTLHAAPHRDCGKQHISPAPPRTLLLFEQLRLPRSTSQSDNGTAPHPSSSLEQAVQHTIHVDTRRGEARMGSETLVLHSPGTSFGTAVLRLSSELPRPERKHFF